jgi:hypothetical protein
VTFLSESESDSDSDDDDDDDDSKSDDDNCLLSYCFLPVGRKLPVKYSKQLSGQ